MQIRIPTIESGIDVVGGFLAKYMHADVSKMYFSRNRHPSTTSKQVSDIIVRHLFVNLKKKHDMNV